MSVVTATELLGQALRLPNAERVRLTEALAAIGEAALQWELRPLAEGLTALLAQDGDWYIAYCPEEPGANGQGRTPAECLESLRAAVALLRLDRAPA